MANIDSTKRSIDYALEYENCNIISPGYKYAEDKDGFRAEKINRKEENIMRLQDLVSQTMKERYQQNIAKILENSTPILYIDCTQKGDLDIMFFLLKEYEKNSLIKDKNKIIADIIANTSIIIDSEQRKSYIDSEQPNGEEIINHYYTIVQKKIISLETEHKNYILNCENNIVFSGLGALMEQENKRHIYLYLDNTKNLSIEEQTRINILLYSRGGFDHNKWIHLKINNGDNSRKKRTTINGHIVQATHDYMETRFYENDIDDNIEQ